MAMPLCAQRLPNLPLKNNQADKKAKSIFRNIAMPCRANVSDSGVMWCDAVKSSIKKSKRCLP